MSNNRRVIQNIVDAVLSIKSECRIHTVVLRTLFKICLKHLTTSYSSKASLSDLANSLKGDLEGHRRNHTWND